MTLNNLNVSTGLVLSGKPLGLAGYDAVNYFTTGTPQKGKAAHSVDHGGATYYFATADNAATFAADPQRYLPSFGGFCAYGVSVSKKFNGDPTIFAIVDGRLHLNLNEDIHAAFNADLTGAIAKADAAWPLIADKPVASL